MVVELLGDASEVRDNVELERSLIAPHTHTLPPPLSNFCLAHTGLLPIAFLL